MINFDSLPSPARQRIIALVASSSSRWILPRYAAISREWQQTIEGVTFAELYLTDGRLHDLGKMMNPRRQSSLQYVMCHVVLGVYAGHGHRETNSQHRESTRVLNDYMLTLFKTMAKWRPENAPTTGTHLQIVVNSPSDEATARKWGDPPQSRRARAALAQIDLPSESLPRAETISGLVCSGRHLELASVTLLVTKLPNLRSLDVELEHDTRDQRDVDQRAEFISSLPIYAPNVTSLRLHRPISNVESNKSPSREQRALFHTRLCDFTQRCTSVSFDDCVFAREFFAPFDEKYRRQQPGSASHRQRQGRPQSSGNHTGGQPELWWTSLRKLRIRNSYMLRRPYTRVTSRSAALMIIHEVLLLAGRALGHMPVLDEMRIRHYVVADGKLETIVLEYKSTGEDGKIGPRLVIDGLRPSVPTMEAWKESVRTTRATHLRIDIEGGTSRGSSDSEP